MDLAEIIKRKTAEIDVVVDDPWGVNMETPLMTKLAQIDQLSQELFEEGRIFRPIWPGVFVLVCKKNQQVGSIILPDKQNKTVWEGIVLATWQSRVVERGTINKDGQRLTKCVVETSALVPGARVVFPHWAGQPVPGFAIDRFRVVREIDTIGDGGIIYGLVETQPREMTPLRDLLEIAREAYSDPDGLSSKGEKLLEAKLEDRFVVVDRDTQSVTLSGR